MRGARIDAQLRRCAVRGARFVCDITLTRGERLTLRGSRGAVRLAREAGGGARHVALGKNTKKSPHDGGLSCEVLGVRY